MLLSKIPFEYFLNVVKQENSAVTEIFLLWFLRPDSLNVLLSEADIGVLGILSEPLPLKVVSDVLHGSGLSSLGYQRRGTDARTPAAWPRD